MNKTELALSAIFRHCDEVQSGVSPQPNEKQAEEFERQFLGRVMQPDCSLKINAK